LFLPVSEEEFEMATTTLDVLTHHLHCFGRADLTGTMADYAPEARIFTPDGLVRGSEAIRAFFGRVFEEVVKPGMDFQMLRQEVDGDTAYIVWKADTATGRIELATDTFIVKDGRIVTQTFAAKISPKQ
jgi:ketosteroid isomerase-like protein